MLYLKHKELEIFQKVSTIILINNIRTFICNSYLQTSSFSIKQLELIQKQ